jgi:hypothetical protein
MLAHLFRERAHANAGEVIDGEACVSRGIGGENAREAGSKDVILQSFMQFRHPHSFSQILKEDLDENTAA